MDGLERMDGRTDGWMRGDRWEQFFFISVRNYKREISRSRNERQSSRDHRQSPRQLLPWRRIKCVNVIRRRSIRSMSGKK